MSSCSWTIKYRHLQEGYQAFGSSILLKLFKMVIGYSNKSRVQSFGLVIRFPRDTSESLSVDILVKYLYIYKKPYHAHKVKKDQRISPGLTLLGGNNVPSRSLGSVLGGRDNFFLWRSNSANPLFSRLRKADLFIYNKWIIGLCYYDFIIKKHVNLILHTMTYIYLFRHILRKW